VTPLAAGADQPGGLNGAAQPLEQPQSPAILAEAAPPARPNNSPPAQAMDRYLNDLVAAQMFHGAVLVARGNDVILSKGYGLADGDTGTPNTALTRFRLASVTKQFTAMGVLILVEQQKLGLDDSICTHLENCPDLWRPITIRNLLNHTSGIADYTDFMDFESREMNQTTPQELMARFRDFPLGFAPGTLYDYCNSNYVLLGLIIERAAGQSYAEFLHDAIFAPLGMHASGYDTSVGRISEGAVGYSSFTQKSGFLDASTLYAAGGLYSTVEDLWLWTQALSSERLVSKPLLDAMFTPMHMGYGFGWKIDRPNNRLRYSHAGDMTGVANYLARYPEQGVTVIVLSNMDYAEAEGINTMLANMVLNSP
jgi:CubicO group peptidase (beta-lactamase class C family)